LLVAERQALMQSREIVVLHRKSCLFPGSFKSAQKRLNGKVRKGNVSLRPLLVAQHLPRS
jgi:hypothetical protein